MTNLLVTLSGAPTQNNGFLALTQFSAPILSSHFCYNPCRNFAPVNPIEGAQGLLPTNSSGFPLVTPIFVTFKLLSKAMTL